MIDRFLQWTSPKKWRWVRWLLILVLIGATGGVVAIYMRNRWLEYRVRSLMADQGVAIMTARQKELAREMSLHADERAKLTTEIADVRGGIRDMESELQILRNTLQYNQKKVRDASDFQDLDDIHPPVS